MLKCTDPRRTILPSILRSIFLLALSFGAVSTGLAAPIISQTGINERAATLLRMHRALIEDPGLRQDGERLDLYLRRIAARLPGEPPAAWRARQRAYAAAVVRLNGDIAPLSVVPPLQDRSAANLAVWGRSAHAIAILPERCAKLLAAMTRSERAYGPDQTQAVGREMTRTVLVVKDAFEALREARP